VALDSTIEHLDEDVDNSVPRQVLNARKMVQIYERSNRDDFVRVWNLICWLEIFLWHLQSAQRMLNRDFVDLQNDDAAGNAADCLEPILDDFTKRLEENVGRRTLNMFVSWHFPSSCDSSPLLSPPQGTAARLAILFSGGIDCAIIAYLAHKCVILYYAHILPPERITRFIPIDEPIDLLNVAFENPRSLKAKQKNSEGAIDVYDVPDRQTGLEQLEELRSMYPHRKWNFVRSCYVLGVWQSYHFYRRSK